jgi:aspartate/tyrosine/aromatic aminotransferase
VGRGQVVLGKSSPIIAEKRVAICQSLSGTGALRIAAEFLSLYNPGVDVYCSDPTWGNHFTIFGKAGLKTHKYRYLNKVCTPYTSFCPYILSLSLHICGSCCALRHGNNIWQ